MGYLIPSEFDTWISLPGLCEKIKIFLIAAHSFIHASVLLSMSLFFFYTVAGNVVAVVAVYECAAVVLKAVATVVDAFVVECAVAQTLFLLLRSLLLLLLLLLHCSI